MNTASTNIYAFELSNWSLKTASQWIKATIRVHNLDYLQPDMTAIFVVNYFTRFESLLLPYILQKHTQRPITALVTDELFQGQIGRFLHSKGTVVTHAPDYDKQIIHSLLLGQRHWLIFPQGHLLRSNHQASHKLQKTNGAALLGLRTEYYRYQLDLRNQTNKDSLQRLLKQFHLEKISGIHNQQTVIIPVNISYYPIRPQQELVLQVSRHLLKNKTSIELENSIISKDSDIDIRFAPPIEIQSLAKQAKANKRFPFHTAIKTIVHQYSNDLKNAITINYDHLLACFIWQQNQPFTQEQYTQQLFYGILSLQQQAYHLHSKLDYYHELFADEGNTIVADFLNRCLQEGVISQYQHYYRNKTNDAIESIWWRNLCQKIEQEIQAIPDIWQQIQNIINYTPSQRQQKLQTALLQQDQYWFQQDYQHFAREDSKDTSVGQPFLLRAKTHTIRAGIILVHGYMAAPLEMRAMAEFLCQKGFIIYAVRLKGHGTSPEDLAQSHWKDWYHSVNQGYAILKTLTDKIIVGGFSTGGVMALLAAANKADKIKAVTVINTPVHFRNYIAHHVPTLITLNTLLETVKSSHKGQWEYVDNEPENPHINYFQNPIYGMKQLSDAIDIMKTKLPLIKQPTLVLQSSGDPIVAQSSADFIFEHISSDIKELTLLSTERHGIVNHQGCERVFDSIERFLYWQGF